MYRTSGAPDPMENLSNLLQKKKAEIDERKQREKLVLLQHRLKCLREQKEKIMSELSKASNIPHCPSNYFRLVHGVRVEARPNDGIAVVLSPVAKMANEARVMGPYEIVLKKTADRGVRLHSYVLPVPGDQEMTPGERQYADDPKAAQQQQPSAAYLEHKRRKKNGGHHVIPIDQLATEHLLSSDDEKDQRIDLFGQSVSALLSAYVRRMCQVAEMIRRFPDEVDTVDASRAVDRVSFVLRLQIGEDAEENELKFHVTLRYDQDKIRPRQGSLRLKFLGGEDNMDGNLKESLEEQCMEFYTRDLADAIDVAFH